MIWALLSTLFIPFNGTAQVVKENHSEMQALLNQYNDHNVTYISANQLKDNYKDYIILDARALKEYEVSHLPGAIWVGESYNERKMPVTNQQSKIVVYCSVGVRSEDYGASLLKNGYQQVYNLHGGIFTWKDAGFKVVNVNGKDTNKVHVYSKKWGKYLMKGEKVY
jgi:rhodanese-related sulfurtransferase